MSTTETHSIPRVGSPDLFDLRPKKGDIWEIVRKGRKYKKEIGRIRRDWYYRKLPDGTINVRFPTVHWRRLPKGRYSSIRVKWLMKNGRRISTKAERDQAANERIAFLLKYKSNTNYPTTDSRTEK